MKISLSMTNTVHKTASVNVKKVLAFATNKSNKQDLVVEVTLRNERTIYVRFLTTNRDIQSKLTNYILTKHIAEELNAMYGSDFQDGYISVGGPDGVSVQYAATSTLGKLLEKV